MPLHLLFFWTKWWWFVMCWCSWRTRLKRVRRRRKGEIEWWETNELNLNSGWTKQEIVYELDACFFLSSKWDYDFWNMWYAGRYGSVHTNCSVMTFCMFWVASEYMGLVLNKRTLEFVIIWETVCYHPLWFYNIFESIWPPDFKIETVFC